MMDIDEHRPASPRLLQCGVSSHATRMTRQLYGCDFPNETYIQIRVCVDDTK